MKSTDSVWKDASPSKQTYAPLSCDHTADAVIIGGGISGVTAAYLMAKAGKKVLLIEKNTIGDGITGYTTAFITYVIDKPLVELVSSLGTSRAAEVWRSGNAGIDRIARIVKDEHISCEFMRCPATVYAADESGLKQLEQEAKLAKQLGFDARMQSSDLEPFSRFGGIVFENQAKFHPLVYLKALAKAAVKAGAVICEGTEAQKITEKDTITVQTKQGTITADHAVIATQYPLGSPITMSARLMPYNSYVISANISSGTLPEGLYWDTESPYHYVRIDRGTTRDRIIVGGEDHKTGHTPAGIDPFERLEGYMTRLTKGKHAVTHAWSAQVLNTADGLPYIGVMPYSRRQYMLTGYNGTGMAYGTEAASMVAAMIDGHTPEEHDLYSPTRLKGMRKMIGRTAEAFTDFVKSVSKGTATDMEVDTGEGKIVEVNGKKIAVYRDESGAVVKLSAVCTHMGCIVQWNGNQKSWDCPCHGSRFDAHGNVMAGPATRPLPPVKE